MNTLSEIEMEGVDPGPIRVVAVDDDEYVLWGLTRLLRGEWPRMSLVATARTPIEATCHIRLLRPHVALLDVFLEEQNALERLSALLADSESEIVVLTESHHPAIHDHAWRCGAADVVTKDAPAERLLQAIEHAHEHRRKGGSGAHRFAGMAAAIRRRPLLQ